MNLASGSLKTLGGKRSQINLGMKAEPPPVLLKADGSSFLLPPEPRFCPAINLPEEWMGKSGGGVF